MSIHPPHRVPTRGTPHGHLRTLSRVAAPRPRAGDPGAARDLSITGGRRPRARGVHRHERVVRAGQPQQREGAGRLQQSDERRRAPGAVGPQRRRQPAVAVRRLRRRLLPAHVPPQRQGRRHLRPLHRRRRRRDPIHRQERHQPAVPGRRHRQRLCQADQPQQRQGPRSVGVVHRGRRPHLAVHRPQRRQPAVAARQARRIRHADAARLLPRPGLRHR